MVLYDSVTFSTTQNIGLSSPIEPEIWYPFWPNRKTNKVQICHFQIGTVNIITLIILLEPVWRIKKLERYLLTFFPTQVQQGLFPCYRLLYMLL